MVTNISNINRQTRGLEGLKKKNKGRGAKNLINYYYTLHYGGWWGHMTPPPLLENKEGLLKST